MAQPIKVITEVKGPGSLQKKIELVQKAAVSNETEGRDGTISFRKKMVLDKNYRGMATEFRD
jgi:hypothetical protein